MSQVYTEKKEGSIPIFFMTKAVFSEQEERLSPHERSQLKTWNFKGKKGQIGIVFDAKGGVSKVFFGASEKAPFWEGAMLASSVPKEHTYSFENVSVDDYFFLALAWGLEGYKFLDYKTSLHESKSPLLCVLSTHLKLLANLLDVSFKVRDWINKPACDLTPEAFASIAEDIANSHKAKVHVIKGEDLQKTYPLVHAVGKASEHPPQVVDFKWGNPNHPKVTLVGKGVTFDTGGLDIKSAHNMFLMKKDMGGAAQALGLADLVMRMKLPIYLRVILPMAENAISGNAYRPGDVITSRSGITVEIGDTDAEGRLLLADALTAACEERPDYIVDFATLTGAARIAVGTEISAFFSTNKTVTEHLKEAADKTRDPLWELPLWEAYEPMLKSLIADTSSCSTGGYAGAITTALFLKKFVLEGIPWVHFDLMAWNITSKPGRPEGGDVMALRAVYNWIKTL